MTKILMLDGDNVIAEVHADGELGEKFVFIITKDKTVYHLDTTDGKIYKARKDLKNLGEGHRKMIEEKMK